MPISSHGTSGQNNRDPRCDSASPSTSGIIAKRGFMEPARPWDRLPTHADIEFAPLYPLNHSYSLSEMNVDPKYYYLFGEGHVLATMHHDGFLNLDLHPEHV